MQPPPMYTLNGGFIALFIFGNPGAGQEQIGRTDL